MTNWDKIEERFDKLWETSAGEGGFSFSCWECDDSADKEEIKDFLKSTIQEVLEEAVGEEMEIDPEKCESCYYARRGELRPNMCSLCNEKVGFNQKRKEIIKLKEKYK